MGEPLHQCQTLITKHKVHVFSSNFSLYGDMSRRVMEILSTFSPDMEIYSIDEAFLDLDGIPGDLTEYGKTIRETVRRSTHIPVSVGIGQSKTLAKIAGKIAKKVPVHGGVFDISDQIEETLADIEVGDIWGIGWQYAKLLRRNGILTALDLKNAPD